MHGTIFVPNSEGVSYSLLRSNKEKYRDVCTRLGLISHVLQAELPKKRHMPSFAHDQLISSVIRFTKTLVTLTHI